MELNDINCDLIRIIVFTPLEDASTETWLLRFSISRPIFISLFGSHKLHV